MRKLLGSVYDLVSNTPPERITQLAERVNELPGPESSARLDGWVLTPGARQRIDRLTASWVTSGIPSVQLAGMLLGASHACHHAGSESDTELVWTGPSSDLVAMRKTERALLQVIDAAQERLFLTSFVVYDVASVMAALATTANRGVAVSMLLESSDKHGGGVSIDGIARMRESLPMAKIYSWKEKGDEFAGGKVHAKVAVCDEALCFISSANLTGHAMEKNMEVGVLIRGGALPRTLHRHLEALVTVKIVRA